MKAGELGEIAADVRVRDLPRLRVVLQVLCEGRKPSVTTRGTPAARQPILGLSQALVLSLETPVPGALKKKNPNPGKCAEQVSVSAHTEPHLLMTPLTRDMGTVLCLRLPGFRLEEQDAAPTLLLPGLSWEHREKLLH